MSKSNVVRIECRGAGTLNIDALTPLQGSLKTLTEENYIRFKNEISEDGFSEPISIWEDPASGKTFILNGHQRVEGLTRLRDEGWKVPQIPVNYVEAESLVKAKRKLLALASQYGVVNPQGLYDFVLEAGISKDDLGKYYAFPDFDPDAFMKEYFPDPIQPPPMIAIDPGEIMTVGNQEPHASLKKQEPKAHATREISSSEFESFKHQCPRCRFEFND